MKRRHELLNQDTDYSSCRRIFKKIAATFGLLFMILMAKMCRVPEESITNAPFNSFEDSVVVAMLSHGARNVFTFNPLDSLIVSVKANGDDPVLGCFDSD